MLILVLDVLSCAILLGFAIRRFAVKKRLSKGYSWVLAAGILLLCGAAGLRNAQVDQEPKLRLPRRVVGQEFVSSDACRKCHPEHYSTWHDTYHRTMTQVVTPETVVAPFDDIELESRGRTYRLERRGDEFWVQAADADWTPFVPGSTPTKPGSPPMVESRVLMSTGSHHMQEYWVANPDPRFSTMIQIPFAYHFEQERWIPLEDVFLQPDARHAGPKFWNNTCIQCHSTGGNPGSDRRTGTVSTKVAEFGIACEACHGPGVEHIRFHTNPLNRYTLHLQDGPDPTIVNPARCSPEISSQICGQCHSSFSPLDEDQFMAAGHSYRAGDDLEVSRRLLRYDDRPEAELEKHFYWRDGTCRVGGDEYLGLITSACHQRGDLSCLSCHSMHDSKPNDQLAKGMETNQACLQCHSSYAENLEAHTHHRAGSKGSECYNCHMPHVSFALFTAMRSHRIDSPDIEVSARTGRPNACNLCHLDETLEWSAQHLTEWYEAPEVELSEEQAGTAASLLWLLRGDAAQRAVTAWHMGWEPAHEASGTGWQAPFLAQVLPDPYALVRYIAGRSLRRLPNFEDFEYDFIGPAGERNSATQRVIQQWTRDDAFQPNRDKRILVGPSGDLRQEEIERLLEQRDDRAVHINE